MLERSIVLQYRLSEEVGTASEVEYEAGAWFIKTNKRGARRSPSVFFGRVL